MKHVMFMLIDNEFQYHLLIYYSISNDNDCQLEILFFCYINVNFFLIMENFEEKRPGDSPDLLLV
jgi:hypothetical protein